MLPGWGSRTAERGGHFLRHPWGDAALEKSLTIAQLLLKCSAAVEWWRSFGSSPGAAAVDFTKTCENFFLLHQEGSYHFTNLPVSAQTTLSSTSGALPRPNKNLLRLWMVLRQSRHDFDHAQQDTSVSQNLTVCKCWELRSEIYEGWAWNKDVCHPPTQRDSPWAPVCPSFTQMPSKASPQAAVLSRRIWGSQGCWGAHGWQGFLTAHTVWTLNKAIYSKAMWHLASDWRLWL